MQQFGLAVEQGWRVARMFTGTKKSAYGKLSLWESRELSQTR